MPQCCRLCQYYYGDSDILLGYEQYGRYVIVHIYHCDRRLAFSIGKLKLSTRLVKHKAFSSKHTYIEVFTLRHKESRRTSSSMFLLNKLFDSRYYLHALRSTLQYLILLCNALTRTSTPILYSQRTPQFVKKPSAVKVHLASN